MKLLLFGRGGRVGWELQRALAPLGDVTALGTAQADFSRPDDLVRVVREVRPDVIVNAAAYTAVDHAESEPALARAVNAVAPGVLADEAASRGAWLVHYSTDYVFDGSGEAPLDEEAPTGPLCVYGRTKLEGETMVRASGGRHLILRISWLHAARGTHFAGTVLRLARERDRFAVVADQFGSPTGADLVADVTAHALRTALGQPALGGTYHLAAAGATSRHAYASFVLEQARARGMTLKAAAIDPVSTRATPTPARRPLNSRFDTRKLREAFGLTLPPWQAGVSRWLDEACFGTRDP